MGLGVTVIGRYIVNELEPHEMHSHQGTCMRYEVIDRQGDPDDGGPCVVAACHDKDSADRIAHALHLVDVQVP